jgi:two-component system phosphate regulon sensor histidine kinase PhoR
LTRFHSRAFAAALTAQVAVLVAATWLVAAGWRDDARAATERRLADQAVLVAEILSRTSAQTPDASLDADADRLAQSLTGRVTLVAPDGRVVGDSALDGAALAATPTLGDRPEIRQARTNRLGVAADEALLYAAVPTNHPRIGFVRVALPPPDPGPIRRQTAVLALGALLLGLPAALVVAWGVGALTQRRVAAIAAAAHRYGEGDLTRTAVDYGSDALGDVARVFDAVVQQLGRRLGDLARDQARMEAVLSGMVEGVLVVDRQGRLQLVNRAAQAMLRVEAGTVGRPYLEVIRHPDIAAQLTSALRGEAVDSRELVLARDPERTFVARAAPVPSGGGGAVLVLHDITDLRRADQIRRDFVANVSHELRTPLTAIRGYVEALVEDPADAESTRRFLDIIARQSRHMERLVRDLLRLARLDAKQEVLEIAPCDLQQLFHAVEHDLAATIEAKHQRVHTTIGPDAGTLEADPAKLHDIVRNLVENAVNYSPEGARVTMEAARDDTHVVITVSDSGPGIPPEDLGRVFERFYRVDKSRSRPGGTGLGLSIVKHLVGLHDGEARAENLSDGGARFTIRLPVQATQSTT